MWSGHHPTRTRFFTQAPLKDYRKIQNILKKKRFVYFHSNRRGLY